MTSPGFGDGGNAYTDDAIAARLSLDLPADSGRILKEVADYSSAIRVNMEATARASGDYITYLQSFPAIQRAVNDLEAERLGVLRQTQSVLEAIRSGGGAGYAPLPGADRVPPGYPGYAGPALPNSYPVMGGIRMPAPGGAVNTNEHNARQNQDEIERQQQLRERVQERNEERQRDRQHGGNGNGPPVPPGSGGGGRHRAPEPDDQGGTGPEDPTGSYVRRIQDASIQGSRALNDAGNIFAPGGGNVGGRVGSIGSLMTAGSKAIQALGPAAGSLGAAAMPLAAAGAVVGGGALAYGAFQKGGDIIQGLRNQDINTHSLGEGLGIQKDIMLMSMNPLLTNEQSREIIMGALKSGRTGESYTSAVDFIKSNLIDMNMAVSDSMSLLRSNVTLGNQSIEKLKFDLLTMQGFADGTSKTLPGIQSTNAARQESYLKNGVSGDIASANSIEAAALFAGEIDGNPDFLSTTTDEDPVAMWEKIMIASRSSNTMLSRVGQKFGKPGWQVNNLWMNLKTNPETGKPYTDNKAVWETLRSLAKVGKDDVDFGYLMESYGLADAMGGLKSNTLRKLYDRLMSNEDPFKEAAALIQRETAVNVGGNNVSGMNAGAPMSEEEWRKIPGNENKPQSEYLDTLPGAGEGFLGTTEFDSTLMENLVESNPRGVLVDKDGKWHLIDPTDLGQAKAYSDGDLTLIPDALSEGLAPGDSGNTLRQSEIDSHNEKLTPTDVPSAAQSQPDPSAGGGVVNAPSSFSARGGNSGAIEMGGAPSSNDGRYTLDISPGAMQFFLTGKIPGGTASDGQTNRANAGAGGATKNSNPNRPV